MPASRPLEPDFHGDSDGYADEFDFDVPETEEEALRAAEERALIDAYIQHDIQAFAHVFSQDFDDDFDDDFEGEDEGIFEDWENDEDHFDYPDRLDPPDLSHYLY